jgi:reverse gyrase
VDKKFGGKYVPDKANIYKSKKDAQEAHEAIRPTNIRFVPDEVRKYLSDEQYRLYKLIWERAVTSQMTPAVFDQTTVEIEAKSEATAPTTPIRCANGSRSEASTSSFRTTRTASSGDTRMDASSGAISGDGLSNAPTHGSVSPAGSSFAMNTSSQPTEHSSISPASGSP